MTARNPVRAKDRQHQSRFTRPILFVFGLIDAIILTPSADELRIDLKGNLAAMLSAATNAKRSPETGDLSLQVEMVAGARNQHYLQLWRPAA